MTRFYRNKNGWYILTTVEVEDSKVITSINQGALGVDFNVNFFSLCIMYSFKIWR